ncbi:MAG: hypothetical protein ACYCXW_10195 [Solirubrobacteraceae bacterium]
MGGPILAQEAFEARTFRSANVLPQFYADAGGDRRYTFGSAPAQLTPEMCRAELEDELANPESPDYVEDAAEREEILED